MRYSKTIFALNYYDMCHHMYNEDPKAEGKNENLSFLKTYYSLIIEAILDYYRSIYDIFLKTQDIALLVNSGNILTDNNQMNTIFTSNTSNANLMENLAKLNTKLFKVPNASCNLNHVKENIDASLSHLCEKMCVKDTRDFNGRFIIFTHLQSKSDLELLFDYTLKQYELLRSTKNIAIVKRFKVAILNICKTESSYPQPKYTSHESIYIEYYNVIPGKHLSELMIYLVQKHYDLSSTTITGIPMKEEQNASASSSNYDVEILHSSSAYFSFQSTHLLPEVVGAQHQIDESISMRHYPRFLKTRKSLYGMYHTVLLQWSTPPKNAIHSTEYYQQNSHGAYPISPVSPHSRPSSCLTNFLLSNRVVLLERPSSTHLSGAMKSTPVQPETFASAYSQALARESGILPFSQTPKFMTSHMLANFGGCLYIMNLVSHKQIIEDPPSISEGLGGRVTDYRIPDLAKLIKSCLLTNESLTPSGLAMGKNLLHLLTIYWPIVYGESLILSIPLLSPLIEKLTNSIILSNKSDRLREKRECLDILEAFHEMERQNQALPGPAALFGSQRSSAGIAARREVYKNVWAEIEKVISLFERASDSTSLELFDIKQLLISMGKGAVAVSETTRNKNTQQDSEIMLSESKGGLAESIGANVTESNDCDAPSDDESNKMGKTKPFGLVWKDILNDNKQNNTRFRPQLEWRNDVGKVELYPFLKERYAKHYRIHPGLNKFNPLPNGLNDSRGQNKIPIPFSCQKPCTTSLLGMLISRQMFTQKPTSNLSNAIVQQIAEMPSKQISLGLSEFYLPLTTNILMANDRSLIVITKIHQKYFIESLERRLTQSESRKQKFPFKSVKMTVVLASSPFKLCNTLQRPNTINNQSELFFFLQSQNSSNGIGGDQESPWESASLSSNQFPTLLCQSPSSSSLPKVVTNVIDQIDEFCISPRDPILAIASPRDVFLLDISNLNHPGKVMASTRRPCMPINLHLSRHNKRISHPPSAVLCSTFSPDGRCLLLGTRDGGIEVYDIRQNPARIKRPTTTLKSPLDTDDPNVTFSVCDMVFCQENVLLTSHYNHRLYMWDLRLSKPVLNYAGHVNSHKTVKISYERNADIVYCGGTDGNVRIWGLWDARPLKLLRLPATSQNVGPDSINRFSPSNTHIRPVPLPLYVAQKFEASPLSSYPECCFVVGMEGKLYAYY